MGVGAAAYPGGVSSSRPTSHHTRRTAASATGPWVFGTRELGRRPGAMREYTRSVPAPGGAAQFGLDTIAVPEGRPIELDLRLESVTEGVYVSGTAHARLEGECARCLAPLTLPVEVEFAELFAYPSDEPFDHTLHGDTLDLEPVVRDAVVLALPFQPECVDGCEDLDLGPGISLITADAPKPADARWAALQGFAAEDTDREER
jgi:uncharacterized protein